MSELDDAIREHLELKRRHGARDAEVKQLEDEAFGTGERPADPFSAADQLLRRDQAGEHEIPEAVPPAAEQGTPTDVPPPETPPPASFDADAGDPGGLAPPSPEGSAAATDAPSAEDEDVPTAPEVLPEPGSGPESVTGGSPIPPPPPPRPDRSSEVVSMPTEEHPAPGPPSEEFAAADPAAAEPGAQQFDEPPPPVVEPTAAEAPPLDAPPADEPPSPEPQMEEPQGEAAAADESFADGAGGPVLYDFEADSFADTAEPAPAESVPAAAPEPPEPAAEAPVEEELSEPEDAAGGDEDAFADLGPADSVQIPAEADDFEEFAEPEADPGPGAVTADTSEREALDATEQYPVPEQEPPPFEPASTTEPEPGSEPADEPIPASADDEADEDLLEETPDFLEEKEGEDEDLWFERRPPKDFDFDD
jgi:hypothetical protein